MSAPRKPDKDLREAVVQQIAKVIFDANKAGLNGLKVAEKTFPGTPGMVMGEAIYVADEKHAEEWWQMVEDTIDGEVVKAAVAIVDKKSNGEVSA